METINTVIFYILSTICTVAAIFCFFQKNTINVAISAMILFFGMSGLYFLLKAPYLGAAQLFLWGGGIGILMLFCAMIANNTEEAFKKSTQKISLKTIAAPVIGVFFAAIIIPFILYGFSGLKTPTEYTIQSFAETLYKNNIFSFELAGMLALVVIIGISAILVNKIIKIKNTRLVKTPENKGGKEPQDV